jgi:hypothetical protein
VSRRAFIKFWCSIHRLILIRSKRGRVEGSRPDPRLSPAKGARPCAPPSPMRAPSPILSFLRKVTSLSLSSTSLPALGWIPVGVAAVRRARGELPFSSLPSLPLPFLPVRVPRERSPSSRVAPARGCPSGGPLGARPSLAAALAEPFPRRAHGPCLRPPWPRPPSAALPPA